MEYDYQRIGERIANERKRLKSKETGKSWTQDDMLQYLKSKNLGISRNTLSSLETGKSVSVDFNLMLEFCKLFDCELGYLLCQEGYENRTRKKTDIVSVTGLTEEAVSTLLLHKRNLDTNDGKHKIIQSWAENALIFLSYIIESDLYWKVIDDIEAIVSIRDNGLNSNQKAVFGERINALRYHELNLHELVSSFIDQFTDSIVIDTEEIVFNHERE